MNVIYMLPIIRFIANQVFPKSPLPLVPLGIIRVLPAFHDFWTIFHLLQFAEKNAP